MIDVIRMLNGMSIIMTPSEPGSPQAAANPAAIEQFLNDDFPGG